MRRRIPQTKDRNRHDKGRNAPIVTTIILHEKTVRLK
jgi:hypothetical protein